MNPQYLDRIADKRQASAQSQKEQSDLAAMLNELKKIQMATMVGQAKPSVVLTDQTDLGTRLEAMVESFTRAVQAADTTKLNKDQLSDLNELVKRLSAVESAIRANKPDNTAVVQAIKNIQLDNSAVIAAIRAIDLSPVVTIAKQAAQPIDFSPLQDTIREVMAKDSEDSEDEFYELSCYRAQDLIDGTERQYVGFVNRQGNWYIIENDIKNDTMRYVFGRSGYAEAFKKAPTYQYELLDKAINAA